MKALYGNSIEKKIVKLKVKNGNKIGHVVLCDDILFHHYFFKSRYIKYTDIIRAYSRVEMGESGDFSVNEYSLVLIDADDTEHVLHTDYKQYAEEILQYFKEKHPEIKIGKK